jgi:hypothetical protein
MMLKLAVASVLSGFALAMSAPAFATDYRGPQCKNCPKPRPHYDTQEVVRTTKDIDHSRVINTQSVVIVPSRKVRTHNHLVIRKNTIRHVGTVRHVHTIIEKEIRYKRRVYAPPVVVNFVTQKYYTTHRPALVEDTRIYPPRGCCRPLRVRG